MMRWQRIRRVCMGINGVAGSWHGWEGNMPGWGRVMEVNHSFIHSFIHPFVFPFSAYIFLHPSLFSLPLTPSTTEVHLLLTSRSGGGNNIPFYKYAHTYTHTRADRSADAWDVMVVYIQLSVVHLSQAELWTTLGLAFCLASLHFTFSGLGLGLGLCGE